MTDEREWLFVTGPPRSGTTLMAFLLNRHPECVVLYETHFPLNLYHAIMPGVGLLNGACTAQWSGTDHSYREHWSLPLLLSPGHGERGLDLKEPEALVRRLCEAARSMWPPLRFFGDKSPEYCAQWPLLRQLFPTCRIIEMTRDEEVVIASARRHCGGFDVLSEAQARETIRGYAHGLAGCPERLQVSLEALQTDPRRKVREALDWLELGTKGYPMAEALARIGEGPVN